MVFVFFLWDFVDGAGEGLGDDEEAALEDEGEGAAVAYKEAQDPLASAMGVSRTVTIPGGTFPT